MDTKIMQFIIEGEYSVDTFFLLSGFLLTYVFLKSKHTENMNISKWVYFYVHRYLRLSPSFYVLFFFSATVLPYIGNGPYWEYMNKLTSQCSSKWWTHIFYFSNVADTTDECLPWTWYLPNDMQFYCLSPVLLVLLKRIEDVSATLYTKPYSRMGPYLIGMLLAYYLHQHGTRKGFIRKWRMIYYWFLSFFGICVVVFGLHGWDAGVILYSLYHATSRHIWAGAVAWIIYACATGQAGPLNSFLSWKAFQPLSRLGYCTYLVHPLFIYIMYYGIRQPLNFNLYVVFTIYAGIVLWSFLAAFAFSMLVETPFAKIEKYLLPSTG